MLAIHLFATTRTVIHSETGLIFTPPTGAWSTVGADVSTPYSMTNFSQMDPNAIKVFHGIFHHASPADDHQLYFIPYSELQAFQSDELIAGRNPFYITATYAGKKRPVLFDGDPIQAKQAINVGDDRYVRFFANEYARRIMLSPNYPSAPVSPNFPTSWLGLDNCTFEYSAYTVVDDNGNPVNAPITWDSPFPQDDSQFLSGIEHFFARLKQIAPDIHVMVNVGSLENNSNFPQVYANVDGIMRENILTFAADDNDRNAFYENLTNVEWLLSAGKVALLRQPVDGTPPQVETSAVAYLLAKDGNSFFSETQSGAEIDPAQYMGMFYSLGSPTGPEQDQSFDPNNPGRRLYSRNFEGGIVYLNWTGATQNVTLPTGQSYFDQNGNAVTQLTLSDETGTYVTTQAGARAAYPSISPSSGTLTGPMTVTISDVTSGAQIYYTLDGSMPTTSSILYSGPFTVSQSAIVTAIASVSGQVTSFEDVSIFNITAADPTANFVLTTDSVRRLAR